MKKIILIFVFAFVGLHCKAQQEYDTMIYHPQEMSGCIMDFDENFISGTGSFGNYFFRKMLFCDNTPFDTTLFLNINTGVVISSNAYNPEAFAQPYHFDSIVSICGIAARVFGINDGGSYFHLMDSSLTNDLASTIVYHSIPQDIVQQLINTGTPGNRFMTVLHNYYFQNPVSVKDFYLTGDVPVYQSFVGNPIEYNHTCSIFDTLCIDTIIGCQSNESPLFKKDGRWIRFSDDTIYELYQKMRIEFLPILLVQRANNSLTDVDLDRTCNVFPNPARDILNVMSQFKVKEIEIYNIIGVKIKEIAINNYEANIDISNFSSGNYIVKLITTRGIATKKLIIK